MSTFYYCMKYEETIGDPSVFPRFRTFTLIPQSQGQKDAQLTFPPQPWLASNVNVFTVVYEPTYLCSERDIVNLRRFEILVEESFNSGALNDEFHLLIPTLPCVASQREKEPTASRTVRVLPVPYLNTC